MMHMRKKVNGICKNCGSEYVGFGKMFCSHTCALLYRNKYFNPVKSEAVRNKISQSEKGKTGLSGESHWNWQGKKSIVLHCEDCGKPLKTIPWGKQNAKVKYCPLCKSKRERSGHWKGGTTPQRIKEYTANKYKEFVKAVLQRDNYTCQECNRKSGDGRTLKLHVHHIKPYAENPELRFEISNGITFCDECHWDTLRNHKRLNRVDKELNKRICQKCGKEFSKRNPRKYCLDCGKLVCILCGMEFEVKNGDYTQKFCSRACYDLWQSVNKRGANNPHWKGYAKRFCLHCGNEISRRTNEILTNYNKRKFCSYRCAYDYRKK